MKSVWRAIRVGFTSCLIVLGVMSPACALTTQEAIESMSGLGAGAAANIANEDPSSSVPKYNTSNANGALYGEGDLLPTDPGNNKITGCAVNAANPNLYDRQDCESVNFVMKNRHVRPNITVSTRDPIIAGNRGITNDPRDTLEKYKWIVPVNADGSVGSLPGNACTATTITTPPMYEEKVCTFYKGSENFLCKAPLVVNVVPHFNYQCQDTYGVNSNESCTKVLHVSCINDCVPLADVAFTSAGAGTTPLTITTTQLNNGLTQITLQGHAVGSGRYTATNLSIGNKLNMEYIKIMSSSQPVADTFRSGGRGVGFYMVDFKGSYFGPMINLNENFMGQVNNSYSLVLWFTEVTDFTVVLEYKRAAATCNQSCSESLENNCMALEQRSLP